ncbi:hypothetical protein [Pleomorphochaeta sp. DL1XJH-081]|jgi:hypothetical protein|uniref:hypothetical protein n=1 Tax=Pleomorphochaeta sp. DL1XJH-081 TaxID=3409690 RepID=UPI003BB6E40F
MKRSNIMLLGAGALMVLLLLASVITARVVFDRSIVQDSPGKGVVYINTNF